MFATAARYTPKKAAAVKKISDSAYERVVKQGVTNDVFAAAADAVFTPVKFTTPTKAKIAQRRAIKRPFRTAKQASAACLPQNEMIAAMQEAKVEFTEIARNAFAETYEIDAPAVAEDVVEAVVEVAPQTPTETVEASGEQAVVDDVTASVAVESAVPSVEAESVESIETAPEAVDDTPNTFAAESPIEDTVAAPEVPVAEPANAFEAAYTQYNEVVPVASCTTLQEDVTEAISAAAEASEGSAAPIQQEPVEEPVVFRNLF